MYKTVHITIIHNCQNRKTTQIFINSIMDKQIVVNLHITQQQEKKQIIAIHSLGESHKYNVEQIKPGSREHLFYDFIIWSSNKQK